AWVAAGARYLHVVDLDGARTGSPQNLHHLERIAGELGVPVQTGGGLRSIDAVRDAVKAGAARVILGTAAFTDVDFLDEVVAELGVRTGVRSDSARRGSGGPGLPRGSGTCSRGFPRACAGSGAAGDGGDAPRRGSARSAAWRWGRRPDRRRGSAAGGRWRRGRRSA